MVNLGEMTRTPAVRLGLIAVLLLLLQVPVLMVGGLVDERQGRQGEVVREFERGWGPAQTVYGPVLAVPYRWLSPAKPNEAPAWNRGWVQVVPDAASVDLKLLPETRRRGMFEATVYSAEVGIAGTLKVPAIALPDVRRAEVLWDEARLLLGVSSGRGMAADSAMEVGGVPVPFEAASGAGACRVQYLAAPLHWTAQPSPAPIPFRTRFVLHGTRSIQVAPEGRSAVVTMQAPWGSPSFLEGMMPTRYMLAKDGFDATWEVPGGPGTAGAMDLGEVVPGCRVESQAGVALLEAVPTYLMVSRTMKYETLFLVLAFLTYFLFETLSGVRIHPMQYGLLGLSVTLFPLILVSVAEPLGFGVGYAVATAAVLAQATAFTATVTRRRALTAWFGAVLAGLFGFLYVVLSLESYALLAGTAALFLVLSVVMAATRRVAWSGAAA